VETVQQAQRTELLFAQFARQTAADLAAVLRNALVDESLVALIDWYIAYSIASGPVGVLRNLVPYCRDMA
jgi:hypothetical protein